MYNQQHYPQITSENTNEHTVANILYKEIGEKKYILKKKAKRKDLVI